MRLILFAVEHGYRQCEKGSNLQATLASVHAMYRVAELTPPDRVAETK